MQVGTQVSGIIDEICVDYNDPVRAGQVIARIDTTLLANAVAGAEAQLARSVAELRQAQREHVREPLYHRRNTVVHSAMGQSSSWGHLATSCPGRRLELLDDTTHSGEQGACGSHT